NGRDSVQADWLRTRLASSNAPFKIVYMHHPPYDSSAVHGPTGALQWPFEEWGASVVLSGHDHLYERLSVSGLPYLVNGLGGNERYAFGKAIGGSQVRFAAQAGAVHVRADEHLARFQFVTIDDDVMDT